MPERYRLLTLLSAWCALRFGEATEWAPPDVELVRDPKTKRPARGILHVRRGVTESRARSSSAPRSRPPVPGDVAIPPHLLEAVEEHLAEHAEPGPDGLLFPARGGGQLAPSALSRVFSPARRKAGR